MSDPSDAAAHGNRPLLSAVCLPIGGHDRGGGQVPLLGEVEVEKGLECKLADRRTAWVRRVRPKLIHQRADHPRSLREHGNTGRADAQSPRTEQRARGGGERKSGTDSPDELTRGSRCQVNLILQVSQSKSAPVSLDRLWLPGEGQAESVNQVPVFGERHGKAGLKIQDVLQVSSGSDSEVEVALQRHTDQLRHRILRLLG